MKILKCFLRNRRNSYLANNSGHQPLWYKNLPRGQIMRLRWNCTRNDDFLRQSQILKQGFIDKGYSFQGIKKNIQDVVLITRYIQDKIR